ncbi:MAG: PaaI family thioesterase [Bacteroidota bacterium]
MNNIQELFKKDYFARQCGIRVDEVREGAAVCTMEVTKNHLNGLGIVMGGALFTLADLALSMAANSYGNPAVTLNAFISYLHSCTKGTLTATAAQVSQTGKISVYRVNITDENGQTIAEMTGTCYLKGHQKQ